ncbi:hypothetical protein [Segatella salivae]|uniref:Uncharacterized protein n=1 Tax=Segatella salivae DSM 15606 TaxID=888832 RepID=E6MSG9_9BACT|nr:hypothetical protein [Segatella salivae]EFV03428.1 hypothetical protein HMPREF9420_2437 [Segatella salivae DSM 15606]
MNEINCIMECVNQRCKRCTFDSPGLSNDSADYPGSVRVVWGTTL